GHLLRIRHEPDQFARKVSLGVIFFWFIGESNHSLLQCRTKLRSGLAVGDTQIFGELLTNNRLVILSRVNRRNRLGGLQTLVVPPAQTFNERRVEYVCCYRVIVKTGTK